MARREAPKRRGMRPYNRSDAPRMRWTEALHARFLDAVHCLGGPDKATPKRILQLMREKDMSITHVKSHLQMYRIMINQNRFHPFLPTKTSNEFRKHDLAAGSSTSCCHQHSAASLANDYSLLRSRLFFEESSDQPEPTFNYIQLFCKENHASMRGKDIELDEYSIHDIFSQAIRCNKADEAHSEEHGDCSVNLELTMA